MDKQLASDGENFLVAFKSFQEKLIADLSELTDNDEFVKDVRPPNSHLTEKHIDDMIALHHGQALRLAVLRGGEKVYFTVPMGGSVHDVFSAVADAIKEKLLTEASEYKTIVSHMQEPETAIVKAFSINPPPRHLNWRKFWRTHYLVSNGVILRDRNVKLKKVPGLVNGIVFRFIRRNRKKE